MTFEGAEMAAGGWAAKRFWTEARVVPAPGGHGIALDARAVKTPAKAPLVLPSHALAEAVAAEWDAQKDAVDPRTMPLTRAANAAIDKVVPQYDEVAEMIAAYGGSDLLCYRAPGPEALVARQAAGWDRWLDWAAARHGARLAAGVGVVHVAQDAACLSALGARVRAHSAFELTGLYDLVALSGSLVLGLAVSEGALDPAAAWDLSRIDETWQAEQWGADEDAEALAAAKRRDFLQAHRFLTLLRTAPA